MDACGVRRSVCQVGGGYTREGGEVKFASLSVEESVEEVGLDEEAAVSFAAGDGILVVVQLEECWYLVHHLDELVVHCHNVSVAIGRIGADLIHNVP